MKSAEEKVAAAEAWFEEQPTRTELTAAEREEVLTLIGSPAMGLFWGYVYGEQLGYLSQLAVMPLTNAEAAARASVIQGKTQGIARVKDTLLELLAMDPTETEN